MVMQIRRTPIRDHAPSGLAPGQLAVEMASNPPRLWVGVPAAVDPALQRVLSGRGGSGGFSTGDVKLTLQSTPQPGWLMCDDGTIGSVVSGATHADDECEALFELLYDGISDANAPLFTSTGTATTRAAQGTAANAWANDCRVSLTRMLGRTLAGAGAGDGLSARALGSFAGAELTAMGREQVPSHVHPPQPGASGFSSINDASMPAIYGSNTPATIPWSSFWHTAVNGGGGAHSSVQPVVFFNAMICL